MTINEEPSDKAPLFRQTNDSTEVFAPRALAIVLCLEPSDKAPLFRQTNDFTEVFAPRALAEVLIER